MRDAAFGRESGRSAEAAACRWDDPEGRVSIVMSCEAVDGLRTAAIDALLSLPRRGAETGGFLLGRFQGPNLGDVWIEAFEPVPCEHRFGPSYALSDSDRANLEKVLAARRSGGPAVVGFYRSYTGRDAAPDAADQELARKYLTDPRSVLLLIRPVSATLCNAAFAFWRDGEVQRSGEFLSLNAKDMNQQAADAFPVSHKGPIAPVNTAAAIQEPEPVQRHEPSEIAPPAMTGSGGARPGATTAVRGTLPPAVPPRRLIGEETAPASRKPRFWLPLVACIVISIGAAAAYEWWKFGLAPGVASQPPAPAPTPSAGRALEAPKPAPPPPELTAPAPHATEPATPAPHPPRPAARRTALAAATEPVVIHEVHPGVPEGIRSRIRGRVVVPVTVHVNESGRVTSALAESKGDSIYRFLAGRAETAARLWRFQPARSRSGARVPSSKVVYFVFTRNG